MLEQVRCLSRDSLAGVFGAVRDSYDIQKAVGFKVGTCAGSITYVFVFEASVLAPDLKPADPGLPAEFG